MNNLCGTCAADTQKRAAFSALIKGGEFRRKKFKGRWIDLASGFQHAKFQLRLYVNHELVFLESKLKNRNIPSVFFSHSAQAKINTKIEYINLVFLQIAVNECSFCIFGALLFVLIHLIFQTHLTCRRLGELITVVWNLTLAYKHKRRQERGKVFCRVKLNPPWENKKVFNKYKSAGASRTHTLRYITVSFSLFKDASEIVDLIDERALPY